MLNAGLPRSWQTVDPSFMTPSRLNTLRLLVDDRHVSLYTLNAPQESMNGVTPLGFAAWMNSPKAVETLLEASGGAVSVDGKDAYGVTPLMCKWDSTSVQASELRSNKDATRDGNLEVVDCLVSTICILIPLGLRQFCIMLSQNSFCTAHTLTTEIETIELPYNMLWTILRYSGLARKHSDAAGIAKFGHVTLQIFILSIVDCEPLSLPMGATNPIHLRRSYNLPQDHHIFRRPTFSPLLRFLNGRMPWLGLLSPQMSP
jgi:hypothetical protein